MALLTQHRRRETGPSTRHKGIRHELRNMSRDGHPAQSDLGIRIRSLGTEAHEAHRYGYDWSCSHLDSVHPGHNRRLLGT